MNQLHEAADRLRKMADEIDGMQKQLAMPVQHVDIPAARKKLRAVVGPNLHISIRPPDFNDYGNGQAAFTVEKWGVYLGMEAPNGAHGTHEGVTLADALNAALKACEPEQQGDVQAEMEKVTEAFAEPLPL